MEMPAPRGHIFIALLTYQPAIDHRVCDAIYAALPSLAMSGWRPTIIQEVGNPDLCDARNTLVSQFEQMKSCTHALLVDADVSWPPGTIERMISHNVDFVLGCYPKKTDKPAFPLRTLPGAMFCVDPNTGESRPDGLVEIAGGPTGLMLISRKVIDKLIEAGEAWYHQPRVKPSGRAYTFFEFMVKDHERWGEDISFCWKWRQTGGKIWLDPHLYLHHHGFKTYTGRVLDYLIAGGRVGDDRKIVRIPLDATNDA